MVYCGVIYCATSPSGKKYYGLTHNFTRRKYIHKLHSLTKKNIFYNAIKKYGFENFVWNIVETYNSENKSNLRDILHNRERFWIDKDKTYLFDYGYNMTRGGDGGDTFSDKSEVDKKQINLKRSKSLSGNKNPMYGKKVYDVWFERFGKEIADIKLKESNKKKSERQKGKIHPHSEETKLRISNSLNGEKNLKYIKLSDEQKSIIVKLYTQEKYSITKIQKIIPLNYYKIKKVLLENGVEFGNTRLYKKIA